MPEKVQLALGEESGRELYVSRSLPRSLISANRYLLSADCSALGVQNDGTAEMPLPLRELAV